MKRATTTVQTGQQTMAPRPDGSILDQAVEQTEKQRSLIGTAAEKLGTSPDKLLPLLRNVWKTSKGQEPLSDQELTSGVALIAKYDLDPFTREVYVSRSGDGRVFSIVGIDGWIKILDRTDHYDGFQQEHGVDEMGEFVETTIYSKKRAYPTTYRAYMNTWRTLGGFMWGKIGHHMLTLLSLRHAARLFTPVGGAVVTEEEFHAVSGGTPQARKREAVSVDDMLAKASGVEPEKGNGATEQQQQGQPACFEPTDEHNAAVLRFEVLRQKAGPSKCIELKEELGWTNTPFKALDTEQLTTLSDKLEEWLEAKAERDIAEADATFAKGGDKK